MEKYKPHMFMVAVQFFYSGLAIISKAALTTGTSYFVLVVYRHLIATVILAPIAYFLERKRRPSITFYSLSMIFLLALFGTTIQQILFLAGLKYTSPTLAATTSNIMPSMTFVMAVLLRMEKLRINSLPGQAKVLGTVICIIGALIVTLYKGPVIPMRWSRPVHVHAKHPLDDNSNLTKEWIKGSVLMVLSYTAWCGWIIFQAKIMKIYPAQMSLITLMCLATSIQSAVIAFIFERNLAVWALKWDIELLNIFYAGIVISVAVYCLQMWCIGKKGPVFAAMFTPVGLVIVSILSPVILGERLHLGSIVGGILVVPGLYIVLWGKRKDAQDMDNDMLPLERPPNEKHVSDGGLTGMEITPSSK